MDVIDYLKKLPDSGVVAITYTDAKGEQRMRNVIGIVYEPDEETGDRFLFTAKEKDFCDDLTANGEVKILGCTKQKEIIRLSAKVVPFRQEQHYLAHVYPGITMAQSGIVFRIVEAEVEEVDLTGEMVIGKDGAPALRPAVISPYGYYISNYCMGCSNCYRNCPQGNILRGNPTPYQIQQEYCLHCGTCYRICPSEAIRQRKSETQ